MKYKGITLTVISTIAIAFIIFNSIFQTFEFLVKYQLVAFMLLIFAFISSIIYAILENLDGKGW